MLIKNIRKSWCWTSMTLYTKAIYLKHFQKHLWMWSSYRDTHSLDCSNFLAASFFNFSFSRYSSSSFPSSLTLFLSCKRKYIHANKGNNCRNKQQFKCCFFYNGFSKHTLKGYKKWCSNSKLPKALKASMVHIQWKNTVIKFDNGM